MNFGDMLYLKSHLTLTSLERLTNVPKKNVSRPRRLYAVPGRKVMRFTVDTVEEFLWVGSQHNIITQIVY